MGAVVDLINMNPSEPTEFSTCGGEGWYRCEIGELVSRETTLVFDLIDEDDGEREPIRLELERDGLYHWRDQEGPGHWCLFRSESATHLFLAGNWRSSSGEEGVSIFVWPKSAEMKQPMEEQTLDFQPHVPEDGVRPTVK